MVFTPVRLGVFDGVATVLGGEYLSTAKEGDIKISAPLDVKPLDVFSEVFTPEEGFLWHCAGRTVPGAPGER